MPLPPLTDWDATAHGLHRATQLVGAIRQWAAEPLPNFLHLALQVEPEGLSTGKLPAGGEIRVDFKRAALIYRPSKGDETAIPVNGRTAFSLFQALLKALQADEFASALQDVQEEGLVSAVLAAVRAKNAALAEKLARLADNTSLEINTRLAGEYADVLYTVFTAVARFRARLTGHMTPVIVWPHHFDLSTLWFVEADMDDRKPHINIGFAPFSEGLPRPYLYVYAHPYPANIEYPALPHPAYWNHQGWTGVVVDYDAIAQQDAPAEFVEQMCFDIFAALQPLIIGQ
jgi:hypothetical protein